MADTATITGIRTRTETGGRTVLTIGGAVRPRCRGYFFDSQKMSAIFFTSPRSLPAASMSTFCLL